MTLYELIFILLFLASVGCLVLSVALRKTGASRKLLLGLAAVWVVYLVVLGIADALTSPTVFKAGEDQCFDEMCFAVVDAKTMPVRDVEPAGGDSGRAYVVTVRVTSHSRGRAQSEGAIRARLYFGGAYAAVSEGAQRGYDAQHGASAQLTQKIGAGESVDSVLVFVWPQEGQLPALTLDHGFTPGYFIFGESPFFHSPAIHELPLKR